MEGRDLSSTSKTLYQILDIPKTATPDEVKRAYWKLALRYHPDKNPDNPDAAEKFKEINHVYTILSDPTKRNIYDSYGSGGLKFFEQFGEEYASAYHILTSGWFTALVIFSAVITCCFCCFCCCIFCCAKCIPGIIARTGDCCNLERNNVSRQDKEVETNHFMDLVEEERNIVESSDSTITSQPTTSSPMPMPPPPDTNSTENTSLNPQDKVKYTTGMTQNGFPLDLPLRESVNPQSSSILWWEQDL